MRLVTFDIFDTTLIRRCGPSSIFELLAKRLYPDDAEKQESFLRWRLQAGKTAHTTYKGKDCDITDIYSLIDRESFSEYSIDEMITTEEAIESENLTANPTVRQLIAEKRENGNVVAFVSDMYLSSRFLRNVLEREGCLMPNEKVYVSCEYNARKDTGTLYDLIKKELKPTSWEHYGDNKYSDIRMAHRHGIKAHYVDTRYNPAEQLMLDQLKTFPRDCGGKLLPAISRAARITAGNSAYDALAADFVAPAYIPYVMHVLEDAKQRGIKRLYFLSRDSYILLRIALELCKDDQEIELRYLFVSRKALLLPYLSGGGAEEYLAVQDHQTIVRMDSVDKLLAQFGTNRNEMLDDHHIRFDYHRVESKQQEADFLHKIFKSDFTPTLKKRAHEQRALLMNYFRQEGLSQPQKSAMVDVGWLGTTRLMINSILREEKMPEVSFYYYGVRGDVIDSRAGEYTTYFNSSELTTEATGVIESYFSASPYPSTIKYEEEEGKIIPIFKEGERKNDTYITKANESISSIICKELMRYGIGDEKLMRSWATNTLNNLIGTYVAMDATPFQECEGIGKGSLAKKLTAKETLKLVFTGQHITSFDKASIRLTLPPRFWKTSWRLHQLTSDIRRKLYLRIYG